ncbi:MAG: heparan-alpha-glucosaminide N-acetyltransferase domain-containing protein [Planctomycetota bacterium]
MIEHTPPSPEPPPTAAARQTGLDVARGLAVAGMAIVNFDLALSDGSGPAWLGAAIESVQGRASALFVVLAGVGLVLLGRSRGARTRRTVLRRGLVLFTAGTLLLPLWPADILHFYGAWFLLAAPLLGPEGRGPSTVFCAAAATAVVALFPALLVAGVDYERHWNFETLEYAGLFTADGFPRHVLFNGFHPTVPWFSFVLLGMAVARWVLDPRRSALPLAAAAAAVAVATETAAPYAVAAAGRELGPLFDTASIPPGPPYVVAAGATAVAVLALCVAAGRRPARWRATRAAREVLGAAGRCALSLYVLHVVTGIVPPHLVAGDAGPPAWSRAQVATWWAIWCALAFGGATWLARRGKAGPLEWLFRRVTG